MIGPRVVEDRRYGTVHICFNSSYVSLDEVIGLRNKYGARRAELHAEIGYADRYDDRESGLLTLTLSDISAWPDDTK